MKQQLEKYLFRQNAHTFAILDGASVPDLPVRLFEMQTPHICLYSGELEADLVHAAPYLVFLYPGMEFTDWLLKECWGRHWGIFAQSLVSITSLRKHFRSLLVVDSETGNPLLFRYYDPRVLSPFLMTCDVEQLALMFGEVSYFFAESLDATELFRFHLEAEKLKEVRLNMTEGKKIQSK